MPGIARLLAIFLCLLPASPHAGAAHVHVGNACACFAVLVFAELAIQVGGSREVLDGISGSFEELCPLHAANPLVVAAGFDEEIVGNRIVLRYSVACHSKPRESVASHRYFVAAGFVQKWNRFRYVLRDA